MQILQDLDEDRRGELPLFAPTVPCDESIGQILLRPSGVVGHQDFCSQDLQTTSFRTSVNKAGPIHHSKTPLIRNTSPMLQYCSER